MSDDIMSCMETTPKASKPDLTDFGALRHSTMVSCILAEISTELCKLQGLGCFYVADTSSDCMLHSSELRTDPNQRSRSRIDYNRHH